ncbi:MAG TPA: SUMF1/EgtB/PvdO family nonheme iron enzyme, partial [Blastocatellia bacterium]|nr:SUMF1/EgtB/PvdO family nonheme iron enzyme [Blastocatellia bacterium]
MSQGRRYAILIGNGVFKKDPIALPELLCPTRDVDGMHEILASPELGGFTDVSLFKDADNHAVLKQIEEVLVGAAANDHVLIYYSGHGKTDRPGWLYLAAANTEARNLISTSIPVEMLRIQIENSYCRRIMLILDCCYGGAAGKSFSRGGVDEKLKELARSSGIYILTASTASQTAEEREGDEYGLLTKHIVTGLKQGDADVDQDGFVSMTDLYDYVFAKVRAEGHQEPMRWALNVRGEELIIARASGQSLREKQQLLTDKVVEIRAGLPSGVFIAALKAIEERRTPFYELVQSLQAGQLGIGEFIGEWYRLESQNTSRAPQPAHSQQSRQRAQIGAVEFETVTLDVNGEIIQRQTRQAEGFTEDLGDGVSLEMVKAPGGTFLMGSRYDEATHSSYWEPRHEVSVPGFCVGQFEVTREQWRQVARMPAVSIALSEDPSNFNESWKQPVERVNWHEANEFCARLSKKSGKAYRLPSESEWEYACRAGTVTAFAFGPAITPKIVNYDGNYPYASAPKGEYRGKTVEVGSLGLANAFGFYDMHGNVWEWCEDVWHDGYEG